MSRWVKVAGYAALAWSMVVSLVGVALVVALPPAVRSAERGYCENLDHPGPCSSVAELLVPGLAVLAIGVWCVTASVGLLRGRRWARWAVAVSFLVWAAGALIGVSAVVRSPGGLHVGAAVGWLAATGFFSAVVAGTRGAARGPRAARRPPTGTPQR